MGGRSYWTVMVHLIVLVSGSTTAEIAARLVKVRATSFEKPYSLSGIWCGDFEEIEIRKSPYAD